MLNISRKKLVLSSLVILLIALGVLFYSRRVERVSLASYVPLSALGYLEINDWPGLLDRFTSTVAWQRLAPAYGIDNKLNFIGKAGWLANLTGFGEPAILARTQFALVVSGLEVNGDEVRPRVALIAETHSDDEDLRKVLDKRLPELARRVYGREIRETGEYSGVPVISFAGENPGRRIFSAQIEGGLILANHTETLRACIDTRLGRTPSMADNFYLANARPLIGAESDLFGFITGEGVTRLLGFGAFLLSNSALRSTGITEILDEVLSDLASRTADGIAYGTTFKNGETLDRYSLLFKPDLVESIKSVIRVNPSEPQSLNFIPSAVKDVTIFNVENPDKTLDGIEAAVAARIGVGHSFLLHQFMLGARGIFLGMKSGDSLQTAIGNEIASFSPAKDAQERVWLIAIRDRQQAVRIIERYLSQSAPPRATGASGAAGADGRRADGVNRSAIVYEYYANRELLNSRDAKKGSAAILGDFIALGRRGTLIELIDALSDGQNLKTALRSVPASGPVPAQAMVIGLTSVKRETGEMMSALAQRLGGREKPPSGTNPLDQLPFASSATTLNDQGFYIESHSSFGNFPFFVSLIESTTSDIK
jgi:hypothetical protein